MENTGIVTKVTGRWFWVETPEHRSVRCAAKGRFRLDGGRNTNPVVVGDQVTFIHDNQTDSGMITGISARRNYIIRRSANLSHATQILAANIDQAILIATLIKPKTYPEFIDRFLVSAEAYRIPVCIVFNKTDLYDSLLLNRLENLIKIYTDVGYRVLRTSVPDKKNIDHFKTLLAGKTSLIAGNSGVGKSTLINTVEPGLNLKTNSLSTYHQSGRHTTTYSEMFRLNFGGYVIDTPGIKGFGLVGFDKEELYHFFPEIFRFSASCNYYNCTHTHEPGCAVKEAAGTGKISQSRYNSYLNLFFEEDKKYRE
ncbi:MAG: ribosome small subunit-dependent GTPase A [Chlorobi bacterium]|nr:ribosome small subunit-dependent GTPase A [Chlorobiota bacterium]